MKSNNESQPVPQRSAEVQAAMDWALPHEEWGKLSAKRMEQTAKIVEYNSANAARILSAEVLRLESALAAEKARVSSLQERADKAESSRQFTREWYSTRIETMDRWIRKNRDNMPAEFVDQFFCIVANDRESITSNEPSYAGLMNTLRHEKETAITERDKLREALDQANKRVLQCGPCDDHACAECQPNSEIIIPGFQCAYHAALATTPKGATQP